MSMRNELLKKLTPPTYAHDKLKYLETKLYEKSEYSSLNKYNRSPYMQSTLFLTQESPIRPWTKRKTHPPSPIPNPAMKSRWLLLKKEPILTSFIPNSDPFPTTQTTNCQESTISLSVPIKKSLPSSSPKSTKKTVPFCKVYFFKFQRVNCPISNLGVFIYQKEKTRTSETSGFQVRHKDKSRNKWKASKDQSRCCLCRPKTTFWPQVLLCLRRSWPQRPHRQLIHKNAHDKYKIYN